MGYLFLICCLFDVLSVLLADLREAGKRKREEKRGEGTNELVCGLIAKEKTEMIKDEHPVHKQDNCNVNREYPAVLMRLRSSVNALDARKNRLKKRMGMNDDLVDE